MATVLTVNAQESNVRQIYDQAENDYQIGRIEQAMDLLQDNMTSFSGNLKVSVYRLLSLCNLGLDNFEEAERYGICVNLNNWFEYVIGGGGGRGGKLDSISSGSCMVLV